MLQCNFILGLLYNLLFFAQRVLLSPSVDEREELLSSTF